jgi:hypothetical protein
MDQVLPTIWEATVPGEITDGRINRSLFNLIKHLKISFELGRDDEEIARFLREWRRLVIEKCGDDHELELIFLWMQLCDIWPKVTHSVLEDRMVERFNRADKAEYSPRILQLFTHDGNRQIARFFEEQHRCAELEYGDGAAWWCTTRQLATMFGFSQTQATKKFNYFEGSGFIRRVPHELVPDAVKKGGNESSIYYRVVWIEEAVARRLDSLYVPDAELSWQVAEEYDLIG